jgi:hypothetical protein
VRKRNRNYKPRILRAPPGEKGTLPVIFGLSQEVRNSMYLALFGMLEKLKTGSGDEEAGMSLQSACNLAEIVARTDKDSIHQMTREACLYASAVVVNGQHDFGWKADEVQAAYIGRAIAYLTQVQALIPRREMKQHIATLDRENAQRLKQEQADAEQQEL